MKKILMLIVFVALYCSGYAQQSKEDKKEGKEVNVPAVAKSAFAKQFPNAEKVKWSLEKPGEYEAEFVQNKVEISVVFDEKGTLLEKETEIKESELPQAVKSAIAKDFNGYKLEEIDKAVAKGVTKYEIEVGKDKKSFELTYDGNGKLLSKKEKKEKD
jgi:ribosomal protein S6E (S10)